MGLKIFGSIFFAFASLITVSLLWKNNLLCFLVLTTIAVLMILIEKSKVEIIVFLLNGLAGAIAEITAVYFGVWSYSNPAIGGIPYWLPIIWGIATIHIIRAYKFFSKRSKT